MNTLDFITAVPLDVRRGSGCYVGTRALVQGLRSLGVRAAMVTPRIITPVYTVTRILFNEMSRNRCFEGKATVGIDADGYTVAGQPGLLPHVACIKGVLGDAVPFETGVTRLSMAFQAWRRGMRAGRISLLL